MNWYEENHLNKLIISGRLLLPGASRTALA